VFPDVFANERIGNRISLNEIDLTPQHLLQLLLQVEAQEGVLIGEEANQQVDIAVRSPVVQDRANLSCLRKAGSNKSEPPGALESGQAPPSGTSSRKFKVAGSAGMPTLLPGSILVRPAVRRAR
jgi:hypothetical protein